MAERAPLEPALRRARVEIDLGGARAQFRSAGRAGGAGAGAGGGQGRRLRPRRGRGGARARAARRRRLRGGARRGGHGAAPGGRAGADPGALARRRRRPIRYPAPLRPGARRCPASISSRRSTRTRARPVGALGVHLKFDTGMNRLGIPVEAAAAALERVRDEPGAAARGRDVAPRRGRDAREPANREQESRFDGVARRARPRRAPAGRGPLRQQRRRALPARQAPRPGAARPGALRCRPGAAARQRRPRAGAVARRRDRADQAGRDRRPRRLRRPLGRRASEPPGDRAASATPTATPGG